jgi:LysM repeat protein
MNNRYNQPRRERYLPAAAPQSNPVSPASQVRARLTTAWSRLGLGRGHGLPAWVPFLTGATAGLLLIIIFLQIVLFSGYYYVHATHKILPGVQVDGFDLGWLTVSQAEARLNQAWNVDRQLALTDGERVWQVTPPSIGLALDFKTVSRQAFSVGRGFGFMNRLELFIYSARFETQIPLLVYFDETAARTALSILAEEVFIPPVDAGLVIEDGRPVGLPSAEGYELDIEQTLASLAEDPQAAFHRGYVNLVLSPVQPAIVDVSAILADARQFLERPVTVIGYDPISNENLSWEIPSMVSADWLKVEPGENGPRISVDEEKIVAHLTGMRDAPGPGRWLDLSFQSGSLAESARQGRPFVFIIKHDPTIYTIQPGDTLIRAAWRVGLPYWKLLEANPGLDPDRLFPGQILNVPSVDEMLPLPVVFDKRIVISISQQRMWVYQDGGLLWENVISTGIDRSPTQTGVFQVQTHVLNAYASVWDLYMPNFLGIYEAWPGFMNGIHGLPTLSNGQRLWANILGRPASYGCIILDLEAAERLYDWAEPGVVVEIVP